MCAAHQQPGDHPAVDGVRQLGQVLLHFVDEPLVNFIKPKSLAERLGQEAVTVGPLTNKRLLRDLVTDIVPPKEKLSLLLGQEDH